MRLASGQGTFFKYIIQFLQTVIKLLHDPIRVRLNELFHETASFSISLMFPMTFYNNCLIFQCTFQSEDPELHNILTEEIAG